MMLLEVRSAGEILCLPPGPARATDAVMLQLPALGRAGELSCCPAWGRDVSGSMQQNCAKLRPFVSFQERCKCPWANPSEGWICCQLVASSQRGLGTNLTEFD